MAQALLQLALALLIAAQQPNVPIDLRNQAISTANMALQYSIEHPDIAAIAPSVPTEPCQPMTAEYKKEHPRGPMGDGPNFCKI